MMQSSSYCDIIPSQRYLKVGNEEEIGKTMFPAKAQRAPGSEK